MNSGIEKVKLPSKIYSIGEKAFACSKIKEIDFSTLKGNECTLNINCFDGCSVETINFNNNHTAIYIFDESFQNCKYLETVDLPTNIVLLGSSIFKNCNSLKTVTFPKKETINKQQQEIPKNTFEGCISLENVDLGQSIIRIYEQAFVGCLNLKKFVCSSNLELIEDQAFADCVSLKLFDLSLCYGTHICNEVFSNTDISDENLVVNFCGSLYFNKASFDYMTKFNVTNFKEQHPFCIFEDF